MSATRRLRKLLTVLGSVGGRRVTSGLSGVGAAARVHDDPSVAELDGARVLLEHHLTAENVGVEGARSGYVGHRQKVSEEEPGIRGRKTITVHARPPGKSDLSLHSGGRMSVGTTEHGREESWLCWPPGPPLTSARVGGPDGAADTGTGQRTST